MSTSLHIFAGPIELGRTEEAFLLVVILLGAAIFCSFASLLLSPLPKFMARKLFKSKITGDAAFRIMLKTTIVVTAFDLILNSASYFKSIIGVYSIIISAETGKSDFVARDFFAAIIVTTFVMGLFTYRHTTKQNIPKTKK